MNDLNAILSELESQPSATRPKRPPLPYRYVKTLDFNPDSHDQVAALAKHYGIKLPRRRDSDDEDALSTEKKYLLRAAKKFPVFRLILDCRERWKMISTYNWKLTDDYRVVSTLGHHPSTWRKSSRSYNLQNIPKRSDLANEFRRMVIAPPGHVVMEGDSAAIEAVLVGYFARSDRLIKLAKSGIHDWFNAHVHGEGFNADLPFNDLKSLCKVAKSRYSKESREVAKRVVHLTNYKGTPERMQEEYPEQFETVKEARRLQNLYLTTEPGRDLQRWWHDTLDRAAHDRYLINPFGFRHRFFHVYGWDKKRGTHVLGDDAKRAIAFLPQSTASAIQDVIIQTLWYDTPFADWLRLPIHDSAISYVPSDHLDDAIDIMYQAFNQPFPELNGLDIGAEIKVSSEGGNWADFHPDTNPLGMKTVR